MGLVQSVNVHHSSIDIFEDDKLVLHLIFVAFSKNPAIGLGNYITRCSNYIMFFCIIDALVTTNKYGNIQP